MDLILKIRRFAISLDLTHTYAFVFHNEMIYVCSLSWLLLLQIICFHHIKFMNEKPKDTDSNNIIINLVDIFCY